MDTCGFKLSVVLNTSILAMLSITHSNSKCPVELNKKF